MEQMSNWMKFRNKKVPHFKTKSEVVNQVQAQIRTREGSTTEKWIVSTFKMAQEQVSSIAWAPEVNRPVLGLYIYSLSIILICNRSVSLIKKNLTLSL